MTATNEAIVRRWFEELWNEGREEVIDELFAEDGKAWGLAEQGWTASGPGEFKQFFHAFRSSFPDLRITIDDCVAAGDRVAVRFSVTGRHTGALMDIPPCHKEVEFAGMSFLRIADGKIQEGWNVWDQMCLMKQIGAIPDSGAFKGPSSK